MEDSKSFKQYCKEAKKRLKNGFWQEYGEKLKKELSLAEQAGVSVSKVRDFYATKVSGEIKHSNVGEEEFYDRVKAILDSEGEISDAIGRLTDKEYYATLSYEEKQRYNLELSDRYLKAVEKYRKEKSLCFAK